MSNRRRIQRVEKQLQQIVANYLVNRIHPPFCGLVTVSRAEVSADIRTARVFVSFMGSEEDISRDFEALQEKTKDIQREVGRQLPMKFCPKIQVLQDKGFEQVERIERILKGIQETESIEGRGQ